jgi:membrane-bound serine protease (ClpP class)
VEVVAIIALIGVGLLLAELLLPTGGVLAFLGACGLIAGGIVALTAEAGSSASDVVGPALITLGVLCLVSFFFIARKVIEAHRLKVVHTGHEELVGATAEARTELDPDGQVWIAGALWRARLVDGAKPLRPGDRVRVEAIEGLTLVVRPEPAAGSETRSSGSEEGAG